MVAHHPDPAASVELGPGSVLGRLANDPRVAFTGFSLGVLQLMHPAVSAGVIQHSDFFRDPFDRVYRSVPRIVASITAEDSRQRAVKVRDYHRDIKGVDANGARYHALDPDVYWWTHMCFVWGFLAAADTFHHRPPRGAERDQFYVEAVEWWRRYGLTMRVVPPDLDGFLAEFERKCAEELEWTEAAERALQVKRLRMPLLPRPLDVAVGTPGTPVARLAMIGSLPEVVRDRFDLRWRRVDAVAYQGLARAVRDAGRLVPQPLAAHANTTFLKRLGARTQLASAPAAVTGVNS